MKGAVIASVAVASVGAAAGLAAFLLGRLKAPKDELHAIRAPSSVPALKRFQSMMSMSRRPPSWYEALPVFRLKNKKGMEVHITPIGAAITQLIVPDKHGKKSDVVLGYDDVETYVKGDPCTYFGVVVGRCANRIANGKFTINGEDAKLLVNNGPNALHGGALGLHKRRWDAREMVTETHVGVELRYDSPHGEEGYPGNLHVTVTYQLSKESNELSCYITATTDEATPVNIAQHSYFNLGGHASGNVLGHIVRLPGGDHYTPVNKDGIPTGKIVPVKGTPFDFTDEHTIGERIEQVPGGYDHNYVLFNMGPQASTLTKQGRASDKPKLAATVTDPASGRSMDVLTTAPGIQFYTGNFLDGSIEGKAGVGHPKHAGLCLETQGFPNAVNEPGFPSVVLQPEDTYVHEVVYKFY